MSTERDHLQNTILCTIHKVSRASNNTLRRSFRYKLYIIVTMSLIKDTTVFFMLTAYEIDANHPSYYHRTPLANKKIIR